VFEKLNLV